MFGDALQPWHLLVLAVVAFLLFGAKRLPELGKGLGEGLKGFKEGLKGISDPSPVEPTVKQTAVAAQPAVSTPPQAAPANSEMSYIVCTRCGNKFDNPNGFKVTDYVCRSCSARS
jgi:sec-independent protein translocase protein TatA